MTNRPNSVRANLPTIGFLLVGALAFILMGVFFTEDVPNAVRVLPFIISAASVLLALGLALGVLPVKKNRR